MRDKNESSGQEREVILRRLLAEIELIFTSRSQGLTIRELTRKLSALDPSLSFNEQTIRRDARALEYQGWVEPRDEVSESRGIAWRLMPSDRLRQIFR
jgi:hypothetical protein